MGRRITIHAIPATATRPYVTLFTTGLSAFPMNVPEEMTAREEYERAELYIQLPGRLEVHGAEGPSVELAHASTSPVGQDAAPRPYVAWHSPITIVPNGNPPHPLASNASFDSVMLVPDKTIHQSAGFRLASYIGSCHFIPRNENSSRRKVTPG